MDYSKTLNLPQTSFSMKANLKDKEPLILKEWQEKKIYQKILEQRKSEQKYVLHDGPPYANGEIHMGHALNKILKDIIVKYNMMKGSYTPFVPGWDCHGLPIELQVVRELKEKKKEYTTEILRKACRSYAEKFIDKQRKGFQRLGVFGLWEEPYLTMSPEYESGIVEAFGKLVSDGYVYHGLKPVHWCPSCETALAEAEVEYFDSTTPTVFVKFPVQEKTVISEALKNKKMFIVIWTTTPWTLPANVAVCFHPKFRYFAVKPKGLNEYWIMVDELIAPNFEKFKLEVEEKIPVDKAEIEGLMCNHPFVKREVRTVFDDYVTLDTGSGIVHIAPGHGEEDYSIGLNYKLPVLSPVNHQGRYTDEYEDMKDVFVLDANSKIIDLMRKNGSLIHTEEVSHSYPHCWRCKNPVIFRATKQWFMKIDHKDLREKADESVKATRWIPAWGEGRMTNMLKNRPDWCLSRQRAWGVPIPAFFCEKCGETLLDEKTVSRFVELVKQKNVDVWFTETAENLLPPGTKCSACGHDKFQKGTDILDVWFDSGVSHFTVLDQRDYLGSPADLYLEGNDQYRGWFQSSLWPSVALNGRAPYKAVLTHGFMLDESGKAMHKSAGNTISPSEIINQFGADVLRLWVVSSDYKEDMRLGNEILKRLTESYRMIRNTVRFLLGNLNGFNVKSDRLPVDELEEFDLWALKKLINTEKKIHEAYGNFEFNTIYHHLNNFCSIDLSATYFNVLKDRLYTANAKTKKARSARTVLVIMLEHLTRILAPILSFTAEEIWTTYRKEFSPDSPESIFMETFDNLETLTAKKDMDAIEKKWDTLLATREPVKKALEVIRSTKVIGDSLEGQVVLAAEDADLAALLADNVASLPMLYIVSHVKIVKKAELKNILSEMNGISVDAFKADGVKCVRCWNYAETVGKDQEHPELCHRCVEAVRG